MSEHWKIYACMMGERQAFVSFDLGIRTELKTLPHRFLAGFRVRLLQQDARGLPTGDEFARLDRIEDALIAAIPATAGVQVGRVTTDGYRYFHFYTSLDKASVDARLSADLSAGIDVRYEHDPEYRAYWDELYPTPDDWRVMLDMEVQDALAKAGDDLQQARPVQHWAYFPSAAQRGQFIAGLGDSFERVRAYTADNGEYAVTLFHHGQPDYHSMNRYTLHLDRLARQFDGEYDGWETQVCKSP